MDFNIGFFALKQNVGCTAIASQVANYLVDLNEPVAVIEKVNKGSEPEYHRTKLNKKEDGTYNLNNVHYYPFYKIDNTDNYPITYAPIGITPTEPIKVYDFGVIDFMFEMPKKMDKIFLVTDANEDNITDILSFYSTCKDYLKDKMFLFDVILIGASKTTPDKFKKYLPFINSFIIIPDEIETKINYSFATRIDLILLSCGFTDTPSNDNYVAYKRNEFYTSDEWEKYWYTEVEKKNNPKKGIFALFSQPKKKKVIEPLEEIPMQKSTVKSVKKKEILTANVFNEKQNLSLAGIPKPKSKLDHKLEEKVKEKAKVKKEENKEESISTSTPAPKRVKSIRPTPDVPDEGKLVVEPKPETKAVKEKVTENEPTTKETVKVPKKKSLEDLPKPKPKKTEPKSEPKPKTEEQSAEELLKSIKADIKKVKEEAKKTEPKTVTKSKPKKAEPKTIAEDFVGKNEKIHDKSNNVVEDKALDPIKEVNDPINKVSDPIKETENSVELEEQFDSTDNHDEDATENAIEFEPTTKYDVSGTGEVKTHVVYRHKLNATGLYAKISEAINRGGRFCCHLFIVTNLNQLFIFKDTEAYFTKYEAIKGEIGDDSNISYSFLTFNDKSRQPALITNLAQVTEGTFVRLLKQIDRDLRVKDVTDEELKEYSGLKDFYEIINVEP